MNSSFDHWLEAELSSLERAGLARRRRTVRRLPGGTCEIGGRLLHDFASNDYLGLTHHPNLIAASKQAAEEFGAGSGAGALVSGRSAWHERLERRIAAFEDSESAVLFPSGYAANLGVLSSLAGVGSVVFSSRLNHASLIDGCRLSGAAVVLDPGRLDRLEESLASVRSAKRRLIVTDSLFSMDGIVAPLADLCAIAERRDALVVIDEAHATGVLGERGRGVAEMLGVEKRVAVRIGTLSKAVGSLGGFVVGSRALTDWLWNRARTQIFSTALPPAACAAAVAALGVIESEPERRRTLHERSQALRAGVVRLGLETVPDGIGPIVPVNLHDPRLTIEVAAKLEQRGFLVGAIRPPSVPENGARLRLSVMAVHEATVIGALLDALDVTIPRDARSQPISQARGVAVS